MPDTLEIQTQEAPVGQPTRTPVATFYRAYPETLPPMRADRSALGTLPAQATQYCEAVTTASAFGWYIFPATSFSLHFDGVDVYLVVDGMREKFSVLQLPEVDQWWNTHCPPELTDMAPPFLTDLGIPGYIQIWSGLLVETRKDWSILVRPIANAPRSNQYFCFEGIVETDQYSPAPLFINLKLQVTNTPIEFSCTEPLFQVQPINRACYSKQSLNNPLMKDLSGNDGLSDLQWESYSRTVRNIDPRVDGHTTGQYATRSRKRGKAESQVQSAG